MDFIYGILNALIEAVASVGSSILAILPNSPLSLEKLNLPSWFYSSIAFINYFIPINFFLEVGGAYLACVAIYYVAQWGLRWIKTID